MNNEEDISLIVSVLNTNDDRYHPKKEKIRKKMGRKLNVILHEIDGKNAKIIQAYILEKEEETITSRSKERG